MAKILHCDRCSVVASIPESEQWASNRGLCKGPVEGCLWLRAPGTACHFPKESELCGACLSGLTDWLGTVGICKPSARGGVTAQLGQQTPVGAPSRLFG